MKGFGISCPQFIKEYLNYREQQMDDITLVAFEGNFDLYIGPIM